MVGGVRIGDDDILYSKAPNDIAIAVEPGVRGEAGGCSRKRVGIAVARKLFAGCSHVICVGRKVAYLAFEACGPRVHGGIAETAINAAEIERTDDVTAGEL